MITYEIAEMLVKETSKVLQLNINIMNEKGIIIATRDPARLHFIHEGALEVIRSNTSVEITVHNKDLLRGTQPGINLPIHFQDKIVGVIGITGDPKDIGDRGGLVKMMAELLLKQAYMATQFEWRQRTKDMIVEELLRDSPSEDRINRLLSLLPLTLKPPFVTALIEIVDPDFSNQLLLNSIEEKMDNVDVLTGIVHANKILIIIPNVNSSETERKLSALYQELERKNFLIRLAYSSQVAHMYHIAQGYRECEVALAITDSTYKVIAYTDVEPKALVHQIDAKLAEQFSERILQGSLKNYIDTLQAFFDCNLHIKNTAEKLFIHRNTLIYRLNKIKMESGYDPQNFNDAFALQMGIWLTKNKSTNVR
ncbi:CdaR family transcriptional regulator [Lederbergia lenta]|uniref:Putative sugar diacid recognition n=1 Tax=Lederbergia lenta TaxID=1467 RepID=A0A2X4YXW7_LEDLE|nr:sugar diacid recognition domain-containing protein [Lederbergia lenta]MEC2326555.1 sugar diacid recognition domain-containing protein [Lederbergia lenta]SQI53184.1 putative sugar diacid recognition [Lederbergia lenta]